jgi:hypothetical protein
MVSPAPDHQLPSNLRVPLREGEGGWSEEGERSQSGEGEGGRVEREALLSQRGRVRL